MRIDTEWVAIGNRSRADKAAAAAELSAER